MYVGKYIELLNINTATIDLCNIKLHYAGCSNRVHLHPLSLMFTVEQLCAALIKFLFCAVCTFILCCEMDFSHV